jgi:hypothetical protein
MACPRLDVRPLLAHVRIWRPARSASGRLYPCEVSLVSADTSLVLAAGCTTHSSHTFRRPRSPSLRAFLVRTHSPVPLHRPLLDHTLYSLDRTTTLWRPAGVHTLPAPLPARQAVARFPPHHRTLKTIRAHFSATSPTPPIDQSIGTVRPHRLPAVARAQTASLWAITTCSSYHPVPFCATVYTILTTHALIESIIRTHSKRAHSKHTPFTRAHCERATFERARSRRTHSGYTRRSHHTHSL